MRAAVKRKSRVQSALKKRGGRRLCPAAAEKEDVPMVRGFYSTEEVLGWVRAAPDGGWGGAEICSVFPVYIDRLSADFFICCPMFRTQLFLI